MKSGFEPAQTEGINRFNWYGPGPYPVSTGQCVIFPLNPARNSEQIRPAPARDQRRGRFCVICQRTA